LSIWCARARAETRTTPTNSKARSRVSCTIHLPMDRRKLNPRAFPPIPRTTPPATLNFSFISNVFHSWGGFGPELWKQKPSFDFPQPSRFRKNLTRCR
jgi:hypothetical protein